MSTAASSTATIGRGRRAAYAAFSGLAGWLAAQCACLPVNLITAVRDSEGQARLFVQTLLYGSLAWAVWTLVLAGVGWLLVVLPLVMTIRPCLLVRLRFGMLALAALIAMIFVAGRLTIYRDPSHIPLLQRFSQLIPYAVFALAFALVTAWVYIMLSKRRLDRAAA